ncbi:hypothetical protein M0657_001874 [Pyricularia oryzae]|nr:hypothetical protein M9X92_001371 [Pyricularia oryzae]KAI7930069.1 hypothetical protein M0657_001874 [Pyricularia oryzae]
MSKVVMFDFAFFNTQKDKGSQPAGDDGTLGWRQIFRSAELKQALFNYLFESHVWTSFHRATIYDEHHVDYLADMKMPL